EIFRPSPSRTIAAKAGLRLAAADAPLIFPAAETVEAADGTRRISSTSFWRCGTGTGGSRMPRNPLIPDAMSSSSTCTGSMDALGRDRTCEALRVASDGQQFRQLLGRHGVVVHGLAFRIVIHQEFSRALRLWCRSIRANGVKDGNTILVRHLLERLHD